MKYFGIILGVIVFSFSLSGQSYTISGYVIDSNNGEPLINATIIDTVSSQHTMTNEYGFYSLSLEKGNHIISCSYVGYTEEVITLNLERNTSKNFNLKNVTITEVVIKGKKLGKGSNSSQMSLVSLPIEQLKTIPVLGGEPDIIKAFTLVPGVNNNGEGSTGLNVRGGGRDQNLTLLDNAIVYNAAHLFGFLSVFNADALQHAALYKGGFPARYGGRLSSIMNIKMKEGNANEFHGKFGLGIINSKLTLEGPISNKISFLFSARSSYFNLFTYFLKKSFERGDINSYSQYLMYDINAKTNYKLNNKTKLFLSFYTGKDDSGAKDRLTNFTSRELRDDELNWSNITTTFRLNHELSPKLFSNFILAYSKYKYNLTTQTETFGIDSNGLYSELVKKNSFNYLSSIQDLSLKIKFDFFPNNNNHIRFGGELIRHEYIPGNSSSEDITQNQTNYTNNVIRKATGNEFAIFIEDDIELTKKIKVNLGTRLSGFSIKDKNYFNIEPRFSSRYLLEEDFSIKASYSYMSQYVHLLGNNGVGLSNDLWVTATENVPPQTAHQYAIGVAKEVFNQNIAFSIEGYYKTMNNLIDYSINTPDIVSTQGNWEDLIEKEGRGEAYGLEVFLQKKSRKFTSFLGYTLSWNNRTFENINKGRTYPFRYDRRHDFSLNIAYEFNEKWSLAGNWVFTSGQPITLPTAKQLIVPEYSFEVLLYERRHNARMPAYHRLDIGINRKKETKRGNIGNLNFSFYNAYNRANPYFVYLRNDFIIDQNGTLISYNPTVYQKTLFGIIPSITYSLEF